MFTGIIQHVGTVEALQTTPTGRRVGIDLGPLAEGCRIGDSVAVAGACLTLAAVESSTGRFDVEAETLRRTTLGALRVGSRVNLERPVRADGLLDGHIVQGHIDGTARVESIRRSGEWLVRFAAQRDLTDQMVEKGSIAIDGVSLTLVEVRDGAFSVALIPRTLEATTLAELRAGDEVNVELDVLGKYVRKYLKLSCDKQDDGLTLEKLRRAGFA